MSKKSIFFISSGRESDASEELWSRTAAMLAADDCSVFASVVGWSPAHQRVKNLKSAGVQVRLRLVRDPLWVRGWNYLNSTSKTKALVSLLRTGQPSLVVLSENYTYPSVELVELCVHKRLPFVTISNGNYERNWPPDAIAGRYRNAFARALRCYFVSAANVKLTEKQLGCELNNAEVVWSQYNVNLESAPSWPKRNSEDDILFACVGRLDPPDKGQDILLEVLARPIWMSRRWHLNMYGEGPMRNCLERLVARLGLSDRVTFAGYVGVEKIWAENHVLVMPSRNEGLPLAVVEAMICGRPVVATDVAEHSSIIVDGVTGFIAGAPTPTYVAEGLERLWASRANLEGMGKAGAVRIRNLVPKNPIALFAEKLKGLID